jgi:hypothetical protein
MSDNYFQSKSFLRKLAPTDLLRYKTGRASENCEQPRTYHRLLLPKYIQPRPKGAQKISWDSPLKRNLWRHLCDGYSDYYGDNMQYFMQYSIVLDNVGKEQVTLKAGNRLNQAGPAEKRYHVSVPM